MSTHTYIIKPFIKETRLKWQSLCYYRRITFDLKPNKRNIMRILRKRSHPLCFIFSNVPWFLICNNKHIVCIKSYYYYVLYSKLFCVLICCYHMYFILTHHQTLHKTTSIILRFSWAVWLVDSVFDFFNFSSNVILTWWSLKKKILWVCFYFRNRFFTTRWILKHTYSIKDNNF